MPGKCRAALYTSAFSRAAREGGDSLPLTSSSRLHFTGTCRRKKHLISVLEIVNTPSLLVVVLTFFGRKSPETTERRPLK